MSTTDNIRMSNLLSVGCFRYEREIIKRNDAENEFVILKKVQCAAAMAIKDISQIKLWIICINSHYIQFYKQYLFLLSVTLVKIIKSWPNISNLFKL